MANVTTNLDQLLQVGLQHQQAGRVAEAEQFYRQVLARQPNHTDALHLLGVLAAQVGRADIAVNLIRQVTALKPNSAEAYNDLGVALQATGQLDEVVAACRQAIALKPNYPDAHYNLGNALQSKGQFDEAIAAYQQAIAQRPNFPQAHYHLGNALKLKGQVDQAIAAYRLAIVIQPSYPEAVYNLGVTLKEMGQLDEAIAAYQQAIALRPNFPEAHNNLGVALLEIRRAQEAIAAYRQAIALRPDHAEAHNNLGAALVEIGQPDDAIAAFRQAIALRPSYPEAHNNLGAALKERGELDEAIATFRQAIALEPNDSKSHGDLILALHYHPGVDASAIAEETQIWNRQHAEPLRQFIQPHLNDRDPNRRLRIGYVSADFRDHVCALFLDPLLHSHDQSRFEIFCYSEVARPDALTSRFQSLCANWRSTVGLTDEQFADRVRQDGIDILVDLKLHTGGNRLLVFARKPAPVQVTWLGYPGTTGLSTIDYRLSDPYLDPPPAAINVEPPVASEVDSGIEESIYSEQTYRLPHTFWCYHPLGGRDVPVNPLPASANGFITFGCLNNFCKVNDRVLQLWSRILGAVDRSRLLLLVPEGSARQRVLDSLRQGGVQPDRIDFVPRVPRPQYLELYHRIDLALDTVPYNGHTTSLDSFWMGVPVVTLVGQTIVGRAGLGQLMNLNLPDLIAHTPEQYVEIAAALARDRVRLAELRSTLRQRMQQSPLMDATSFARDIDAAYRHMWTTRCSNDNRPATSS